jgi:enamine deaminase RidA (YjgF/YER057c/UK114 family)
MKDFSGMQRSPIGISTAFIVFMSMAAFGEEQVRIQRFKPHSTPGFTSAVRVANAALVHTTQLIPSGSMERDTVSQSLGVLEELDRLLSKYQSKRSDIVKLNVYVQNAEVGDVFLEELAKWSNGELPAVAFVATSLPDSRAQIAVDAVFVSRRENAENAPTREGVEKNGSAKGWARTSVLPVGDVIYVSGQAQPGQLAEATQKTLDELHRTLKFLELERDHIVQVKCFVEPMKDIAAVNREIENFFGEEPVPPVSHVEWISPSMPIEIELVAWAPAGKSTDTVSYLTPPWMKSSPVFSRVARIHGNDRIYISGLSSQGKGNGESEVRSVFQQLQLILKESGSDLKHLAKATYYVASDEASRELNRLRPEFYDPIRPPAASKAVVSDVGIRDRKLTLDMTAAPVPR